MTTGIVKGGRSTRWLIVVALCIGTGLIPTMCASASDEGRPPIDLNEPVENPTLVAAIERFAASNNDQTLRALLTELNRATFLVAILSDEMRTSPSDTPGKVTIEKGSLIKMLNAADESGNPLLCLFTDWRAIRAYTDSPVNALVMPALEAWEFALHGNTYFGVVVNPGKKSLPLNRAQLENLLSSMPEQHR